MSKGQLPRAMRAAGYSIAGDQGLEIRVGAKSFEGLLSCPGYQMSAILRGGGGDGKTSQQVPFLLGILV